MSSPADRMEMKVKTCSAASGASVCKTWIEMTDIEVWGGQLPQSKNTGDCCAQLLSSNIGDVGVIIR